MSSTRIGRSFDLKRPTVSEFRVLEAGPKHAVIQVAEGSDYVVENGKFLWRGDWGSRGHLVQVAIPEEDRCWRRGYRGRDRGNMSGWDSQGQQTAMATDLGGGRVRLEYSGSAGDGMVKGYQ